MGVLVASSSSTEAELDSATDSEPDSPSIDREDDVGAGEDAEEAMSEALEVIISSAGDSDAEAGASVG